jgi:hypothetical protein
VKLLDPVSQVTLDVAEHSAVLFRPQPSPARKHRLYIRGERHPVFQPVLRELHVPGIVGTQVGNPGIFLDPRTGKPQSATITRYDSRAIDGLQALCIGAFTAHFAGRVLIERENLILSLVWQGIRRGFAQAQLAKQAPEDSPVHLIKRAR